MPDRGQHRTSGYHLTRHLLALDDRPEAIVACNDNMAVGAYRAIAEAGLTIPDDIAIASFNDISVAQFLNPPLTTVRLPSEEIGEAAVELLVERASGRELAKHIMLASEIKWRGSTRLPPGARAIDRPPARQRPFAPAASRSGRTATVPDSCRAVQVKIY